MRIRDWVRSLLPTVAAIAVGCGVDPSRERRSVAELEVMLSSPDSAEQVRGAFGLGRLGRDAKPAIPSLVKSLDSPDPLLRTQAALALGAIGPEADAALPALVKSLGDSEWTVRRQSALSLGQIGPAAELAATQLRRMEKSDASGPARKAARQALSQIKARGPSGIR